MKKSRVLLVVVLVVVALTCGVLALAGKPGGGGGGGGTQNCKFVSCAQCPEGFHLAFPQVWPNCCNCVPD